jgi:hypothetical protein
MSRLHSAVRQDFRSGQAGAHAVAYRHDLSAPLPEQPR